VLRRWVLNRAARKLGATKLAIGHNLDDVSQTVFMNLMRNEPFRLARFGPKGGVIEDEMFVDRIRPLYWIPEREIALYAVLKGVGIDFRECPYAHEAFRGDVRNYLNSMEEKYPGTKNRIAKSFSSIKPVIESLFSGKRGKPSKCIVCGEPSSKEECKACEMIEGLKKKKELSPF
jgi:uncharacterized protein (TIGR00269 family)